MPIVEIQQNRFGPTKRVDVPEGGQLVDICDEAYAPVPFSCRSATCGTCQIRVTGGGGLLEPAGPEERELLEILAAPANGRLACQARIKPGHGVIRIVAVEV